MRIVRIAVVHVLAGEVVGVFTHVERAEQYGAGRFQALDQRLVVRGRGKSRLIFEPARVGRPVTSNRFFTANGTPASGHRLALRTRRIDRAGALHRALRQHVSERVEHRIARRNARERILDNGNRRDAPLRDRRGDLAGLAQPLSNSTLGFEDRRGLGIVRQLLLSHERGKFECDLEIGARPPASIRARR